MSDKPIPSPCISLCLLNDDDVCVGCYRSAGEIRDWISYNNDERLDVLEKCGERARKINPLASY